MGEMWGGAVGVPKPYFGLVASTSRHGPRRSPSGSEGRAMLATHGGPRRDERRDADARNWRRAAPHVRLAAPRHRSTPRARGGEAHDRTGRPAPGRTGVPDRADREARPRVEHERARPDTAHPRPDRVRLRRARAGRPA